MPYLSLLLCNEYSFRKLECENEKCKVWVSMRVPEGWKGDGVFKCGLCVMKEVVEVKREIEKMKRENENLKHEVEVLKNEDIQRGKMLESMRRMRM